jgi:hypothetical protein
MTTSDVYFGRRLEPQAGRIIHCAGQSDDEFRRYYDLMDASCRPMGYMTYIGLRNDVSKYFARLSENLSGYDAHLVPQIGLSMTHDGEPEKHYEHDVADGKYDAAIETFCRGLSELNRPAMVRIGYEFNGHWNGYSPETYKAAFTRVAGAIRRGKLDNVAIAWCFSPDGKDKTYWPYYPGDEWVDWWAIDLFSTWHFAHEASIAFMEDAAKRRYPVMVGESTPRFVGVQDGEAGWEKWFMPYFDFMRRFPHTKMFSYISWEWSKYPQWHDWGNGRIGDSPVILERWRQELAGRQYLHGTTAGETMKILGIG